MNERTIEQIKEDNDTRFRRAGAWLKEANGQSEPPAKFVFSWIAFNAQFADKSAREKWEKEGRKRPLDLIMICSFVDRIVACGNGEILVAAIDAVKPSMREIFHLPQTYHGFWDKPSSLRIPETECTEAQWKSHFHREVSKCYKQLSEALAGREAGPVLKHIFDRLYVVRNQVFHGGHSRSKGQSLGYTQIRHGAEVLVKMTQCFQEVMAERMDKFPKEDWGVVDFRRQGKQDDPDCPPRWLSRK